jgi:hypothetical protein
MRTRATIAAGLACLLAGCSDAQAAPIDPANDVHCAVMATAFQVAAAQQNATSFQQKSACVLAEWYAPSLRALATREGEEKALAQVAPLVEAVEADMLGHKDSFVACVTRAADDPRFDSFAAAAG